MADQHVGVLYAIAWSMHKTRKLYFAQLIKKDSKLLTFTVFEGKTADLTNPEQQIDHNLEIQEIKGLLNGPKPNDVSQAIWNKAKKLVDDNAAVGLYH